MCISIIYEVVDIWQFGGQIRLQGRWDPYDVKYEALFQIFCRYDA